MKAWVLNDIGNVQYEDTDKPQMGADEVLVKVKAAGICGSDIPRIYKTGAYHHPLIPGHEFSGQVVQTYNNNDKKWIGKRVGIFPLIPCGECVPCKRGLYEMCRNYSYLGSRRDGGFAEYAVVPVNNLIELPENVSFEEAAMLEPMAVAVHSIRRISPKKDDRIFVYGLGTIGLFITMFLREMGMENIYTVGNKNFQRERVIQLGISGNNYCDGNSADIIKILADKTNRKGADVFFECIGKNEILDIAVNSAAPGGRIMLVGNPYSDVSLDKATYWKILRNQLTVYGTWNSSFTHKKDDDWHYVLDKLGKRQINPVEFISHRLNMNELEKGFHIMRDKSEDYVKIIMSI